MNDQYPNENKKVPMPPELEQLKDHPYQDEIKDMQYEGGIVREEDDGLPQEEPWYIKTLEWVFARFK